MKQKTKIKLYRKYLAKSPMLLAVAEEAERAELHITQEEGLEKKLISSVINYVLAPALNGYIVWVLHQALEKKIKRLYFLARDGYFMYQYAMQYVNAYHLPIECRYLYCSRYSVRLPAYHLDIRKAVDYITLGGLDVTIKKLYQRAGFNKEQRHRMYEGNILPFQKEEQIPRNKLSEIGKILAGNKVFIDVLTENSKRAVNLYEKYLKQEGLDEEISMALVDSGWVGSMQKELNQVLIRMGKKSQLAGFYWGIYQLPQEAEHNSYYCYFFSPERKMRRKIVFNNCLFEAIFTAPHGMTLGYEKQGAYIKPVLSKENPIKTKRVGWMEELLRKWQHCFQKAAGNRTFEEVVLELENKRAFRSIEKNLELFMHHPTKEEANVFGELDFSDDILENQQNKVATPMTEKELSKNHIHGRLLGEVSGNRKHIKQSAWYEGSAAIYGKHPEYHIFHYTGCRYLKYLKYCFKKTVWRQRNESE